MILVDTSVVIDYARGKDAKLAALLPTLPVATCGIVRAELLCGARDAGHRANLATLMAAFHQLAIAESLWDTVGDHLAALRSADVVIAALAMEYGIELWTPDAQFRLIQNVLPTLKLFHKPP